MTRNLEEELANHLKGCFFWEKTTKYEDVTSGDTAEIRRIQKKFADKKEPKLRKIDPIAESNREKIRLRMAAQKRLPDEIRKVKDAILKYYELTEAEFEGDVGRNRLFPARCHYIWAVLRYNPNASLAGFGREIGKHHTTIIYNQELFEKNKHLFEENIKAIDEAVGYKPV